MIFIKTLNISIERGEESLIIWECDLREEEKFQDYSNTSYGEETLRCQLHNLVLKITISFTIEERLEKSQVQNVQKWMLDFLEHIHKLLQEMVTVTTNINEIRDKLTNQTSLFKTNQINNLKQILRKKKFKVPERKQPIPQPPEPSITPTYPCK